MKFINCIRRAFLDISKAFNKVWYKSLIFKLKLNGLTSDLLNIFIDFLKERKQKPVLNGQHYGILYKDNPYPDSELKKKRTPDF